MSDPSGQPGDGWAPPSIPAPAPTPPPTAQTPIGQTPTLPQTQQYPTQQPAQLGAPTFDQSAELVPLTSHADDRAGGRSKGTKVGALVGVGALIAAGTFAVVKIAGNDDNGGAASPSEVGTLLTAALDNEDVLGVIDLLLPGERETFRDPLIRTVENLRRLELLADDASLDSIGGVDIEFADVTVREEQTNVADIVNIYLSGSSTVTVDGDKVPLGDLLIDEAFDGERPDMPSEPESADFEDTKMTVVERGGRWYLSAFYSIAEQARGGDDIPDKGIEAVGADKPEAAVDDLLDAMVDLDVYAMVEVLDPTEVEALQRYAPLFLDVADEALIEVRDEVEMSLSDVTYSVQGSGSRRSVTIETLKFEASESGGDGVISVEFADGCVEVDLGGETTKSCGVSTDLDDLLSDSGFDDSGQFRELFGALQDAFADYESSGVAVHEVDGRWYVSAIRTGFNGYNDVLDALDADEIRDIIQIAKNLDLGFADDFATDFDTGFDPGGETSADSSTDPSGGDSSGDAGDAGADELGYGEECYAEIDPAAGVQCLLDGIADGSIDPDLVSGQFRFAECGVAEVYWLDIYSMSDADFVAMVEKASPCFLDLVKSGQVESYYVPSEMLSPACLEGMNWYTNYEEEYGDRFFECIDAVRSTL